MEKNKAMVIGAAGWLGSKLVARLIAQGREVIAVDINLQSIENQYRQVELIHADIRSLEKFAERLRECAVIFNCAGLQHPKRSRDLYSVNAHAPAKLFEACLKNGVSAFVHISSITAHGQNDSPTTYIEETIPSKPITHYGKSKAEGEKLLKDLAEKDGTRLIILRPGVFYGKNPSKNIRELLEKMRKGPVPIFSSMGFLRTYVDVEKVVEAMLLSEKNGVSGESYLIGDAEPLSTMKFYRILYEELSIPPKVIKIPVILSRVAEMVALLFGKAGIHIRIANIMGEFGRHCFLSPKKAVDELLFKPLPSSGEGLREMVRSIYKNQQ